MSTYLLPVSADSELFIDSCKANSIQDAENKWIDYYITEYEIEDNINSWDDLVSWLNDHDIEVGYIYDIEEF